jgi:hypothetical protein
VETVISTTFVKWLKYLYQANIMDIRYTPLGYSNSNVEILRKYQNEVLRTMVYAPWYISNKVIHADLRVSTIREEITQCSIKYKDKITTHSRKLASTLLEEEPRSLKRFKPTDLTVIFS